MLQAAMEDEDSDDDNDDSSYSLDSSIDDGGSLSYCDIISVEGESFVLLSFFCKSFLIFANVQYYSLFFVHYNVFGIRFSK